MAELVALDVGHAPYEPTLRLQQQLVAELKAGGERDYLVLVEHDPPVITLGRKASADNILASPERLAAEGIEVCETGRGGDVTYHGPGQLVAYPIVRLDQRGHDVGRYVRDLENVLIRLLGRFGIEGRCRRGMTGVWVDDEKVAAIGVAVSRWVTYHGFALNVTPNLSHFDLIVPCGIRGKRVTSLERLLDRPVSVAEVKPLLVASMVEVFAFDSHVTRSCDSAIETATP